jgi:hypothetical protein
MNKCMAGIAALVSLAIVGSVACTSAAAQTRPVPCGPRSELLEMLNATYQEEIVWRGRAEPGVTVELLISRSGGRSWSILVTNRAGQTCLVASGREWNDRSLLPGEQGA